MLSFASRFRVSSCGLLFYGLVFVVISGCAGGSASSVVAGVSNREIAPTPTFIVVTITPKPVSTATPRPDSAAVGREGIRPVSFPSGLDPDARFPPTDEESVMNRWVDFLSGVMVMVGDGGVFHLCDGGKMLVSGAGGGFNEVGWRVGWTDEMLWMKWWEIGLFVDVEGFGDSPAAILSGRDGELFTSTRGAAMGLFESDEC